MSSMPNSPLHPQNYPGAGQFVILCEGDLTGYEAALLGLWLRERRPTEKAVDVRPCGTSEALIGTADAIGRTVRIVVVEDRDFRSPDRAAEECAKKLADRETRGLAMRGWRFWSRNEIENYFLDDEVLVPTMREVFGCSDDDTRAAREGAIKALRVFQVVQSAVSSADVAWEKLSSVRRVGGGRPKWTSNGLEAPEPSTVRTNLEKHIKGSQKKVFKDDSFLEPFLGEELLSAFDTRLQDWSADRLPEDAWKKDWAGKEVLKLVRQQLAARFRPPLASTRARTATVDWHRVGEEITETDKAKKRQMQEEARGALDRDIERAIQPYLVQRLWDHLEATKTSDMNADFEKIANCFVI
jgi:hypothetical protein